ncbi:AMP-binding protein [Agromyces sp. ZXT2-6]|uniref:AMP-binding protein n=1 Tax=Agromyces sp. ZXT2-6 TaxID=3461153 RepID=UPI004054BBBF
MRTTLTRTEPTALDLLGGDPDAPALVTPAASVDYAELADRVAARRAELGTGRRMVFLAGSNTVESVVTYLAALAGGHPVLFVAPDAGGGAGLDALVARYEPDVVVRAGLDDVAIEDRGGSRHRFHPDLALLASTSGSTGSPKLVRLSRGNVLANARSIAEYLRLTPADRAATTLPLHYCYGLSVVNSHLIAGGSLLLTDRSVVEPGFWADFDAHEATSIAGVPYTYELLESTDFARRPHPTLRYVTQAGGRLAPERVRRLARLGRETGFDVFVMYGQTEATARMAYLPPELAETAAGAIGVPIPGGAFRIDETVGGGAPGEGELVYSGPNVMMGYAETPDDLARGAELAELRTGDLARRRDDGLVEITGRLNRFVKAFGLRLDLDLIERRLADGGLEARAVGVDERLAVFVREERSVGRAHASVARITGLPPHGFDVHAIAEFPRTPNGKPDHAALRAHASLLQATDAAVPATHATDPVADLRDLYAELLGRPDATPDDSFTTLDGDSLNYVELALQLEARLGALPADWPSRSIHDLSTLCGSRMPVRAVSRAEEPVSESPAAVSRRPGGLLDPQRRRIARVETSVVLRALAIVLIVATHADVVQLQGGAHLLLAVAGFNLARFRLTPGHPGTGAAPGDLRAVRSSRVRGLLRSVRAIAVPAVLWVGGVALVARTYDPATVALSNWLVGSYDGWTDQWHLWFLEALVWAILAVTAIVAVPRLDALERRRPYAFAAVVLVAALALRYAVSGGPTSSSPLHYALPGVAWLIALGWLIARSTTTRGRVVASVVVLATVPGFFGDPVREGVVIAGLGLLVWATSLPVPAFLAGGLGTVASASMFVYLTHWQVYPPIEEVSPPLAIAASFGVGIGAWWGWDRVAGWVSARRPRRSRSAA